MRDRLEEFGGAEIAVVFFDSTDRLTEYRDHHDIPQDMILLADPERRAYAAFDLGRGSWWRVWGPRTWLAYARLLRSGSEYHRHRGDALQLGGDFVVAADGTLVDAFRPAEPDDRPPVRALVDAVTRANGRDD